MHLKSFLLVGLLSTICSAQSLEARLAELNVSESGDPKHLTTLGSKILFSAKHIDSGRELFIFDPETGKSELVKDILEGDSMANSIADTPFIKADEIVYFSAQNNDFGFELWRSDGTAEGTYMVKDINENGDSDILDLTAINGILYFSAIDGANGRELWRSDGTESGTYMIKDIFGGSNGSSPVGMTGYNNEIYFTAFAPELRRQLWKTDGTESGTVMVKDFPESSNGIRPDFIVFQEYLYFVAVFGELGEELWRSNGTTEGTALFKEINPGEAGTSGLKGIVRDDYFLFRGTNALGSELWKCDGTPEGTTLVKDIYEGPAFSLSGPNELKFVLFGDNVYFAANSEYGMEIWKTDGTEQGTILLKDIAPGDDDSDPVNMIATSDALYFSVSGTNNQNFNTLWKSDGTEAGTIEVSNAYLDTYEGAGYFATLDGALYFAGHSGLSGWELWKTEQTGNNAVFVSEINFLSGSGISYMGDLNGKFIFGASNGVNGFEPFISNGTIQGTRMIKDVNTYLDHSSIPYPYYYPIGFIAVDDYGYYPGTYQGSSALFRTDGTAENTTLVKTIYPGELGIVTPTHFINYDGVIYFHAFPSDADGAELWRSDGTEEGTYAFTNMSSQESGVEHDKMIEYDGYLYFCGYDEDDNSIWRTDGTPNGTEKVMEFPIFSGPKFIDVINGRLIFSISDDALSLWAFGGNTANNELLVNFEGDFAEVDTYEIYNDKLYFEGINPEFGTRTLFVTDGTAAGTMMVDAGLSLDGIETLKKCGNYLYYTDGAPGSSIKNIWRTDGTIEGTAQLEAAPLMEDVFALTFFENDLYYLKGQLPKTVWHVNDEMSLPIEHEINILNSEEFQEGNVLSVIEGFKDMYKAGDIIYMLGVTEKHGEELYIIGDNGNLSNENFDSYHDRFLNITLYPNPSTTGSVYIRTLTPLDSIELFTITGQRISKVEKPECTENTYKLENLPKGLHLIRVISGKKSVTKKIIIQ